MVYDREVLEKLRACEDAVNGRKIDDFVSDVRQDVVESVPPYDFAASRAAAWAVVEFIFLVRGNALLWRTAGDVRRFLEKLDDEKP